MAITREKMTASDGRTITISFIPFPEDARGAIFGGTIQTDSGYEVFIDSTRSRAEQLHTVGHELAHIILGHFSAGRDADPERLEEEAEEIADRLAAEYGSMVPQLSGN